MDIQIKNFENNENSYRHGRYGGQAGDKDGIIVDGENWIVKYPKNTKGMTGNNLPPYTTAPLSEYIGSHIYEILGYDVHKTELCIRNNKLAVACKDFQENFGDLAEIRAVKNSANRELSERLDKDLPESATGDNVILEELLLHFENNPLMNRQDLKERFWDCVVIDIFIDNKDRNNGNWGLLWNEKTKGYDLAPIYDNGNSFETKANDEKLLALLNGNYEERMLGGRTVYSYNEKLLSAKKILNLDIQDLKDAVSRVYVKIQEKMPLIIDMIDSIPEKYGNIEVCSPIRKEYYKKSLEIRKEKMIEPVYLKTQEKQVVNEQTENKSEMAMDFDTIIKMSVGIISIPEKTSAKPEIIEEKTLTDESLKEQEDSVPDSDDLFNRKI